MGLFRPYEQGTSKKTGPTEETVEAEPGSSTESSSSSATAAPRRAPKTSSTGKKPVSYTHLTLPTKRIV